MTAKPKSAPAKTAGDDGEKIRAHIFEAMDRGHAEHLFPMIESVLATAGASYAGLSRVAVCTGPGSFTGVRIGVAAALLDQRHRALLHQRIRRKVSPRLGHVVRGRQPPSMQVLYVSEVRAVEFGSVVGGLLVVAAVIGALLHRRRSRAAMSGARRKIEMQAL